MPRHDQRATGAAADFEPGGLRRRIREQSAHGLTVGALQPIATEAEVFEDGGIPFLVRHLVGQKKKIAARVRQEKTGRNPFLPYEEDLCVGSLSSTHVCLLNKFNVVDDHILIVTRAYEEQAASISHADFAAVWTCLREIDGFAFYNSGPVAGASQPHKHLQLVPVPLGSDGHPTPIDALLSRGAPLPFTHAVSQLEVATETDPESAATALGRHYEQLLRESGLDARPGPNNLLMTRRWMILVPRRRETHQGVIANAMGFGGTLLVRSPEEMETLRRVGPVEVLAAVSGLLE